MTARVNPIAQKLCQLAEQNKFDDRIFKTVSKCLHGRLTAQQGRQSPRSSSLITATDPANSSLIPDITKQNIYRVYATLIQGNTTDPEVVRAFAEVEGQAQVRGTVPAQRLSPTFNPYQSLPVVALRTSLHLLGPAPGMQRQADPLDSQRSGTPSPRLDVPQPYVAQPQPQPGTAPGYVRVRPEVCRNALFDPSFVRANFQQLREGINAFRSRQDLMDQTPSIFDLSLGHDPTILKRQISNPSEDECTTISGMYDAWVDQTGEIHQYIYAAASAFRPQQRPEQAVPSANGSGYQVVNPASHDAQGGQPAASRRVQQDARQEVHQRELPDHQDIAQLKNPSEEFLGHHYKHVHTAMRDIFRRKTGTDAFKKMKKKFSRLIGKDDFERIEAGQKNSSSRAVDKSTKKLICKAYAVYLEFEFVEKLQKMQETAEKCSDEQILTMRSALEIESCKKNGEGSPAFQKMKSCISHGAMRTLLTGAQDQAEPLMQLLVRSNAYYPQPEQLPTPSKRLICRAYRLYLREKLDLGGLEDFDHRDIKNIKEAAPSEPRAPSSASSLQGKRAARSNASNARHQPRSPEVNESGLSRWAAGTPLMQKARSQPAAAPRQAPSDDRAPFMEPLHQGQASLEVQIKRDRVPSRSAVQSKLHQRRPSDAEVLPDSALRAQPAAASARLVADTAMSNLSLSAQALRSSLIQHERLAGQLSSLNSRLQELEGRLEPQNNPRKDKANLVREVSELHWAFHDAAQQLASLEEDSITLSQSIVSAMGVPSQNGAQPSDTRSRRTVPPRVQSSQATRPQPPRSQSQKGRTAAPVGRTPRTVATPSARGSSKPAANGAAPSQRGVQQASLMDNYFL